MRRREVAAARRRAETAERLAVALFAYPSAALAAFAAYDLIVSQGAIVRGVGVAILSAGLFATRRVAAFLSRYLAVERRSVRASFSHRDVVLLNRMAVAADAVTVLAKGGVIEREVALEVTRSVRKLKLLIHLDGHSTRIGGSRSNDLRRQAAQLTAVLVDLVDAAVERHVSELDSDTSVSMTLQDQLDRLATETIASRELGRLGRILDIR